MPFFDRLALVVAGMQHQVLGADGCGALQFAAESGDGFGADHRVERGEVDQVVDVDGQRVEVVTVACGAKQANLVGGRAHGAPHARAGGEDLEGIRAEFGGLESGAFEGAGDRRVDAETHRYMLATSNGDRVKTPTRSCPGHGWNGSAVYAIAEFLEFPDHARSADPFGLGAHRWTPFLVANPVMQDHPKQLAKPMGDGPDGLLVSQPRQQAVKCHFKYAPFDLDRCLRCLIQ